MPAPTALTVVTVDVLATTVFLGGAIALLIFALFSYMGVFSFNPNRRAHFYAGKHVLVTGGSSGIGKSLAQILLSYGACVTIVARNEQRLNGAAADLAHPEESDAAVTRINVALADCSDSNAVDAMVEHVESRYGPVDILVNCAGAAVGGYMEELDSETFRTQMDSNYFTQVFPTHALFKRMASRRAGHIVFVSSMAGLTGVFGQSAYAPCKYAIRGLAETVYYEGKPFGIEVTVVFPPDTDTPGLLRERESMPPETEAISDTGGLFSSEAVARLIADGVMKKRFRVCVGLIGRLLGILGAGLTPGVSVMDIIIMPIARAITPFFIWNHNRIIAKGHAERFAEEDQSTSSKEQRKDTADPSGSI